MSGVTSVASPTSTSAWWRSRPGAATPDVRLLCFPHAGGGASTYRDWSDRLPDSVESVPVQLPGREHRLDEPLPESLRALVEEATDAIYPLLDVPFVFFGASFGAILALEIAHHLRATFGFGPSALAVSGEWAPTWPGRREASVQSHEQFVASVRENHILPAAVLNDPDLLAVALPALRGDTVLSAQFRDRPREPLDCPLYVIRGRSDPRVIASDMRPWASQTTARSSYGEVDSGHLVIESGDEVVDLLVGELRTDKLL